MRNRHIPTDDSDSISWVFNDFILGFLMVIMMIASIFAVFSSSVVVDSFINQCEDSDDPDCGKGNSIFGGREKGIDEDKLVNLRGQESSESLQKWGGVGQVGGNISDPDLQVLLQSEILETPQKQNIVFRIEPDGQIKYKGRVIPVTEFQGVIQEFSLQKGVFLEAIVDSNTPFAVYKETKNLLWDLTDAEHWRAVSDDGSGVISENLQKFGTTYLDQFEGAAFENPVEIPLTTLEGVSDEALLEDAGVEELIVDPEVLDLDLEFDAFE